MLADMRITEYLDELASKSPAPGGGSVAALVGANGAALVSMVCNLTIGKKGYEEVRDDMVEYLKESERLRDEFIKLIDLDAEAFNEIMDAYRLPKSNDEEKNIRKEAIQAATRKATMVPVRTIELAVELLSLTRETAETGNENVISDAAVAASLGNAAMESGWFNVKINLNGINDDNFIEEITEHIENLFAEGDELYEGAMEIIEKRMD
ncbi:methenyltetrahydrofolate cyclohydrolase [bacterium]|nr:MAG: methenyltetrahydrofolate cyclohydrolase [bacterium]